MNLSQNFWIAVGTFAVSTCLSVAVWSFVRPPAATAVKRIATEIEMTGQMRGVVEEAVLAVEALTKIRSNTASAEIQRRRERTMAMVEGCVRLAQTLSDDESSWIPVAQARLLLLHVEEFGRDALRRSPSLQVDERRAAEALSTETDPDMVGMTPETVQILETRAISMRKESLQLQQAVQRAAMAAASNRGSWLGFEAGDYLFAVILVNCLIGTFSVLQFRKCLEVVPFRMVEIDLKLLSEHHPQAALDSCYQLSETLLRLADQILDSVHSAK